MATEAPNDRYEQVYQATYDAVWAVVGEVVYGLVLAALFLVGLDVVVVSLTGFATTATPIAVVFAFSGSFSCSSPHIGSRSCSTSCRGRRCHGPPPRTVTN